MRNDNDADSFSVRSSSYIYTVETVNNNALSLQLFPLIIMKFLVVLFLFAGVTLSRASRSKPQGSFFNWMMKEKQAPDNLEFPLTGYRPSSTRKQKAIRTISHLKQKLDVTISSPLPSKMLTAFSFAADSLLESLIIGEAFFFIWGSVFSKRDRLVDDLVRDILIQSGVRGKYTVLLIDVKEYIAFTTTTFSGRHYIGISSGIVKDMSSDEVSAIIAHEAGHVKNKDTTKSIWANFVDLFSHRLIKLLLSPIPGLPGFATRLVFSGICQLFLAKFFGKANRRIEFLADMHSVEIMGSPEPLISALQKIDKDCMKCTPDEAQTVKEISQLYGRRGMKLLLQDIGDSVWESLRVINSMHDIPTHPLTRHRILNLKLYAQSRSRSDKWYAPIVKLLGLESAFGIPKQ